MVENKVRQRRPATVGSGRPNEAAIPQEVNDGNFTAKGSSKPRSAGQVDDWRGRPLFETCYVKFQVSLLSHYNREWNLRGLFNLLLIIVFVQNFRLVIENLLKYGVRIKPLAPTSFPDLIYNWPILLSYILMQGVFVAAFFMEKYIFPYITKKSSKGYNAISFGVASGNILMLLAIPFVAVKYHRAEPLSASVLLASSIVWCLKLVSFHHVMQDIRYSLIRKEPFTEVHGGSIAEKYPHSLQLRGFYRFLIMPVVCYQLEFPTKPKVRWVTVIRHLGEMVICMALIKIIIEQYMLVIIENTFLPTHELLRMKVWTVFWHLSERILKLSIPNLYVWLLIFAALFHHWLNILAEITRFGDCDFYQDWWNATSLEEYWRKWNLPIHFFFSRHVLKPLLRKGIPKIFAGQIVFFISALAHEYLVIVPLHIGWTGLIFTAFISQVPLMYLTTRPFVKDHPTLGNGIFWILFCFTGQPLTIIVYYYLWARGDQLSTDFSAIIATTQS